MSKVTGKFQITLPKHLVEAYGIKVGDELELIPAGDRIAIVPVQASGRVLSAAERLRYFDEATRRQRALERTQSFAPAKDRGWRRDELYNRGRSR